MGISGSYRKETIKTGKLKSWFLFFFIDSELVEEVLLKGWVLEKDNRFIGKEQKYITLKLYFQLLALIERRKMEYWLCMQISETWDNGTCLDASLGELMQFRRNDCTPKSLIIVDLNDVVWLTLDLGSKFPTFALGKQRSTLSLPILGCPIRELQMGPLLVMLTQHRNWPHQLIGDLMLLCQHQILAKSNLGKERQFTVPWAALLFSVELVTFLYTMVLCFTLYS